MDQSVGEGLKRANRITFAETCNRKGKANPEHNAEDVPEQPVLSQIEKKQHGT